MKVTGYLVISRKGAVRFMKGIPGLDWDEISMKVAIKVPDALFQRPALQATITIPAEAAVSNPINVDVINNMQDAIKQATNMEINIVVGENEPE